MGKLLEKIKTKAIERLTDDFGAEKRVVPPTNNGSIHSLADVDIHTITDRISRAYSSANIGTWAYTSEINLAMYHASMEMNRSEKETTLDIIGCDAAIDGDGTVVTPHRNQPHTTAEIDYVNTFQAGVEAMERQGFDTTQQEIDVYNNGYYSGLDHGELNGIRHNDLYTQSHNLYYDDDNKLYADKVTNVIQPSNPNSIVSKTKQLFNENKINTIVSAFHTKPTAPMKLSSAKTVKYGMSHGRNLLLKSAERGDYANYDIHGYDNPYCRVWTHHYQYNRRDRLIRPFVTFDDSERENTTSTDIAEWHNFARQNADWKDKDGGYAWKSGNVGWELSVLHNDSKNGTVNIAPKYSNDPNHKTIKPIDCMFSIENLAWQGYDPYSFQKALSNEQRGPMGGRIMWFPPYDIRFSESVNVNWNQHNFIGRGEAVHTYNNTSRSGSLSFKILVDHPSYTDLMLHHDGEITTGKSTKSGAADTDFLRFFAGCDMGEVPEPPKHAPEDLPEEKETEETEEDLLKFSFYVFYPNNYSGVHDTPGSKVEAIPYLLAGSGAQKNNNLSSASAQFTGIAKQKNDRLQEIKDWLKESYVDIWTSDGLADIKNVANGSNITPLHQRVVNIDIEHLLDNFNGTSIGTGLSMYCGHFESFDDFRKQLIKTNKTTIDGRYNGCFFTTPQSSDKTKVAVNYYDADTDEWISQDINSDLNITYKDIDTLIGLPANKQVATAEALFLYLNNYYGIMQLATLNEAFTENVKNILGSTMPTKDNVDSIYETYDSIIGGVTTISPLVDYYNVLDISKDNTSDLAELSSLITLYVNGENVDIDEIFELIENYTPNYLFKLVQYYNNSAASNQRFGEYSGDNTFFNTIPNVSFSDMVNTVFTTIYQLENEIKAINSAVSQNTLTVNDNESDVAISMKQLFESNGVGYEMLKVVKNGSFTHEPTYNEVRDSNCAFGISNVQRYLNPDVRVKDNPSIKNISGTFNSTVPTTLNSGSFPEDSINPDLTWEEITNNHIKGTRPNWQSYKSKTYIPSNQGLKNWDGYDYIPWYYRIDGKYKVPNGETETFENYYDQFLEYYRIDKVQNNAIVFSNYRDSQTYGLNCDIDMVKTAFQIKDDTLSSNKETLYSLAEIAYAITDNQQIQDKIIEQGLILSENNAIERIDQLKNILKYSKSSGDIQNNYEIVKIEALGYSNSHANNASININKNRNDHLATNRAKTVVKWLKQNLPNLDENVFNVGVTEVQTSPSTSVGAEPNGLNDVSQLKAKQYRSAKITIYVKQNIDKDFKAKKNLTYDLGGETITVDTTKSFEIDGMMFAPTSDGKHYCHITDKSLWVNENGVMKKVTINKTEVNSKDNEPIIAEVKNSNILRYDNESQFFRELQIKDPIVFSKLVDKLQVFDPAFHSMTPEGFNARLTFLHQCTRQGDTHTLSDTNRTHTPKNLQFGKAPVCILRLGDFYHQQILINSMSISFDETTWDLNTEGIGVQPMIANVNLSIIFIGGGDLAGAVQRLQNAATFNYYANTRLYDNRADRVVYEEGNTGVIDTKRTYSHNVPYAGIDTNKK